MLKGCEVIQYFVLTSPNKRLNHASRNGSQKQTTLCLLLSITMALRRKGNSVRFPKQTMVKRQTGHENLL